MSNALIDEGLTLFEGLLEKYREDLAHSYDARLILEIVSFLQDPERLELVGGPRDLLEYFQVFTSDARDDTKEWFTKLAEID